MEKYNKIKAWAKQKKIMITDKGRKFIGWCKDNPMEAVGLATLGTSVIGGCIKQHNKRSNLKAEKQLKENYIYDRRKGHYVESKRALTGSEWSRYDALYSMGMSSSDILRDMKLLK